MRIRAKNNLSPKSRIIASVVAFVIILLCVMALTIPASQLRFEKKIAQNDDLVAVIKPDDIKYLSNCTIDAADNVTINGEDAHIVFSGHGKAIRTVKLNLNEISSDGYFATLYYDATLNFSEDKTDYRYVAPGDDSVCFEIPESINNELRLDIDNNYTFKSIELHSKAPNTLSIPISISIWKYFFALIISIGLSVAFFLFDKYICPLSEKIVNGYLKNYKKILFNALTVLLSLVVSVGIEFILSHFIFGVSSTGSYFNGYRYLFIVCVLLSIVFIIKQIKNNTSSEKIFAVLMLIVGMSMILCSPFGHICWDYDSHSEFVLEQSYIGDKYITVADKKIFKNEVSSECKDALTNIKNIEFFDEAGNVVVGVKGKGFTTIAHFHTGLAVAVTRFLGFSYTTSSMFGRTANLIVYILICYFAMIKLKSGKAILATIAFFPTNLFLATNYSYDYWVTAFIFLGTAYFISEIKQQQKVMPVKDIIIMNGAFILACIPKQIYMPIMILPLLMRKKWKNKSQKRKYYLICLAMLAFMAVLLIVRAFSSVTGGGDTRGGSEVNSMEQFSFIMSEPLSYTKILLNFLKTYLSVGSMKNYINIFAYLGKGTAFVTWLFIAAIIFTTATDKDKYDNFNGLNCVRIIDILLFFGIICLVATSLYILFTAVGSKTILGCQGRYITPLLLPLLLVIASPGLKLKINKIMYNNILFIVLASAVFVDVGCVFLPKLM